MQFLDLIPPEDRPLLVIVAIFMLATVAKAFKRRTLDIREFIGELIMSGLVAVGVYHLGMLQGVSESAIIVGAVCWATGVSFTRHAQWAIRIAAMIANKGDRE